MLDKVIKWAFFHAYAEEFLAPELRLGDIVVIDNLGSHKGVGVREALEARSADLRYLPPHSNDFNSIKRVYAKLKSALRSVAARTHNILWSASGTTISTIRPTECANSFVSGGHRTLGCKLIKGIAVSSE